MEHHNLPSYNRFRTAESKYLYLLESGASDNELETQSSLVQYLRDEYERDREQLLNNQCIINRYNLRSLIDILGLMNESGPDDLFVFDFDETLMSRRHKLWLEGVLRYNHNIDSKSDARSMELLPYPGFQNIIDLSRQHPTMILTRRNTDGVNEINDILSPYNVNIPVAGTIDDNGKIYPKGDILLSILNANRPYNIVNFIDDGDDNILSVQNIFQTHCPYKLTINLYKVPGESAFDPNISENNKFRNQEEYINYM